MMAVWTTPVSRVRRSLIGGEGSIVQPRVDWWARRSRVRAGLLAAIALVVATATVLISVILGVVQRGTTDGVRGYLAERSGSATVLSFATSPGTDPQAQTVAAHALVDGLFSGLPVELFDRTFSGRFTITAGLTGAQDTQPAVRWGSYPGAEQHATLLGGRWPVDTGAADGVESAIPVEVADRLGLRVGGRLGLIVDAPLAGAGSPPTLELVVTGIFRPDVSGFWSSSRALVPGAGVTDPAPVFQVAPQVLTGDRAIAPAGSVLVGWTLVPRIGAITGDQVAVLRAAVGGLPTAVRADTGVNVGGTLFAGGLDDSLETAAAAVARATAAAPLPLVLVALFCLVMLVQLGRLLTDDRRPETVLLLSRGLSAARASWWAALEASVVALTGAAVGTAIAALGPGLVVGGLLAAAAAVAVATVAALVPAHREAATPLVRDRTDDSGRGRVLVAGGAVLLVSGAALFTWWRFRRSPGTPTGSVEPAVLLAPAVILLAGGLVATVLFGMAAALVARLVPGRDRGIGWALPVRQIARRATVYASIVLLGSLSVGGALLASTYTGTVAELERSADRLQVGPDVRIDGVEIVGSATDRGVLGQVAALPEVRATSPVLEIAVPDGESSRTIVGLRSAELASLLPAVAGTDPALVAAALQDGSDPGEVLPDGASGVRVVGSVTGPGRPETVTVAAWWATSDGLVVRQTIGSATARTLDLRSVAPVAGSRLVAVDLQVERAADPAQVSGSLTVAAVDSSGAQIGAELLRGNAGALRIGTGADSDATAGTAAGFRVTVGEVEESVRPSLVRFGPGLPAAGSALAGVVDARTAESSGLAVGDVIGLSPAGAPVGVRIAAVVPVLPGFDGTDVVLTDLLALQRHLLTSAPTLVGADGIWIGSGSPRATAAAAGDRFGGGAQIAAIGGSATLSAPAIDAYRWGTAGSLGLALAAVAVVAVTLAHRRRAELVVLSALGVRPARQAALRRRELGVTVLIGWALGGVLGWLTVTAVVPRLAVRSVVGGQAVPDPGLSIDVATLALPLTCHALGVLLVVLASARQVRSRASTPDPRWVMP